MAGRAGRRSTPAAGTCRARVRGPPRLPSSQCVPSAIATCLQPPFRQGLAYAKRALLHAQYYAHLLGAAVSGRQKTCLVKAADWLGAAPVGAGGEVSTRF